MTTTEKTTCAGCNTSKACKGWDTCLKHGLSAWVELQTVVPSVPIPSEPAPAATLKADAIQIGGDHYKIFEDYQPWQVFEKWYPVDEFLAYLMMSAINYLPRERYKGGVQDVKKAIHTLQKWVEVREANPVKNQ
jgi:hypothetical protein